MTTQPNPEELPHEMNPEAIAAQGNESLLQNVQLTPDLVTQYYHNPQEVVASIMESQGVTQEIAEQQVAQDRELILRDVIAPAGLAEASTLIAERMNDMARPPIEEATRLINETDDVLNTMALGAKRGLEEMQDAKRLVHQIRDVIENDPVVDPGRLRGAINRLYDFHETYRRSQLSIQSSHEDGVFKARHVASSMGETAELGNRGFREIYDLEQRADEDPASMMYEGIGDKLAEQPTSVDEFKDANEREVTRSDSMTATMKRQSEEISQEMNDVQRVLMSRDPAEALPRNSRVMEAIDNLSSMAYKIEQHGDVMKRMAVEASDDLQRLLRQIETGFHDIAKLSQVASEKLTQPKKDIQALRDEVDAFAQAA